MLRACLKHRFRYLGDGHGGLGRAVGESGDWNERRLYAEQEFVRPKPEHEYMNMPPPPQLSIFLRRCKRVVDRGKISAYSVSNSDGACFSGWDNIDWLRSRESGEVAVGLQWDTLGGNGFSFGGRALLHIRFIVARGRYLSNRWR